MYLRNGDIGIETNTWKSAAPVKVDWFIYIIIKKKLHFLVTGTYLAFVNIPNMSTLPSHEKINEGYLL